MIFLMALIMHTINTKEDRASATPRNPCPSYSVFVTPQPTATNIL